MERVIFCRFFLFSAIHYVILNLLPAPPFAKVKGGEHLMEAFFTFLESVIAGTVSGVIADRICKWLDRQNKGSKH